MYSVKGVSVIIIQGLLYNRCSVYSSIEWTPPPPPPVCCVSDIDRYYRNADRISRFCGWLKIRPCSAW